VLIPEHTRAARPGRTLRTGLVGCGLVARVAHAPALAELPERFEVVAVADPDAGARDAFATRSPAAKRYPSHRAMLEAEQLDAVVVAAPNHVHAAIACDALDAGAHVLVEKPLCLTVEEADRIVAARDAADRVVQVGYMKRFDPAFARLLEELPDAAELLHVASATYDPGLATWFDAGTTGAGDVRSEVVLGALIHDVNLVAGIADALGLDPGVEIADAFVRPDGRAAGGTLILGGTVRWSLVWLRLDGLGDFREELVVYARDGIRRLEFPAPYLHRAPTRYERSTGDAGANVAYAVRRWSASYVEQLRHFHACVTEGAACRAPAEQGRRDVALLSELFDVATEPVG